MRKSWLLLMCFIGLTTMAWAQTGTVKGNVVDDALDFPLVGATVQVVGTGKGAVTDLDGNFTISNVPAGAITLQVSYISYKTQTITGNTLGSGATLTINVRLEEESDLLDEVLVEARANRESENLLLLEQRQALLATAAIGAMELSRKGIGDAEAAVAQISGVSKQEGEKNVFIRGLADRYNQTMLNGFPIPSDDPEYKNIALDIFDSDMIQSVGVSKAFSAQYGGDVGGAVIDIQSKELVGDNLFEVGISGGGNASVFGKTFLKQDGTNYFGVTNRTRPTKDMFDGDRIARGVAQPFPNKLNPTEHTPINHGLSLALGKRLKIGDNPLSLLLVANHNIGHSFSERISRTFSVADLFGIFYTDMHGPTSTINTRQMVLGNAILELDKKHHLEYTLFFVHSNSQYVNRMYGLHQDKNQSETDGFKSDMMRQQANDNYLLVNQLTSKWKLADKLHLSIGGAVNILRAYEPDRRTLDFYLRQGIWVPNFSVDNKRFYSDLRENDYMGRLSFDWEYMDKSFLSVGYNFRYIDHQFEAFAYQLMSSGLSYPTREEMLQVNWDDVYQPKYMDNYYDGVSPMAWIDNGPAIEWYYATRLSHSAYLEAVHQFTDQLSAQVSVRADMIDEVVVDGKSQVFGEGGTEIPANYKPFILPSINLKYDITPEHTLRLSASRSYTLPRFKERSPYRYVNIGFASEGNPNIKHSQVWNVDLKYDWYISEGELFSTSLYYKHIENPLSRVFKGGTAGVMEYANPAKLAQVAGVEVELKKELLNSYKPTTDQRHKLAVGFTGSYIFTDMLLEITNPVIEPRRSKLEGASPWLVNADLSYVYSKSNKDIAATLLLHYHSDRIHTYGTIGADQYDLIEKGLANLDFVFSADLWEGLSMKIKVGNIINTPIRLEQRPADVFVKSHGSEVYKGNPGTGEYSGRSLVEPWVMSDYSKGTTFSLSLKYKF